MRNGELVFLGRTDNQVKVRGFRIEPEEVEAALNLHPAVRSCAVVARVDPTHNTQLVAFVIPQGGAAIASADLRRFLQERLPDYMVPGSISFLDALPITPAGKVNRRALEESRPGTTRQEPYVAPRTPLEKTLAGIWMSLLSLNVIGIHSNFFDLGGHSLLATQVVARIQRLLGVDLPLRRLFETPTVAELALAIVEKQAEQVGETALNKMLAELEEANPRLEDSAEQTA
jgi:acyl carrier protein